MGNNAENTTDLSLPKAHAKKLSNKPVLISTIAFCFVMFILVYSIHTSAQPKEDNRFFLDISDIENGEFWLIDGVGLAINRDRNQPTTGVIGNDNSNSLYPAVGDNEQGNAFLTNADGTISAIETDEQGRQFIRNADGSITYINPNSKDEFVRNSDGSISYAGVDEQGQEFVRNPDGSISVVETDEQGRKFVRNPDGSISYIEDGEHARAKVINPNGNVSYVTKTDKGTIIENADGTVTNIIKGEDGRESVIVTGTPNKNAVAESVLQDTDDSFANRNGASIQLQNGGLTPEEIETLRKQRFQNYVQATSSPVLAKQVNTPNEIVITQGQAGVSSNFDAFNALASMEMPAMQGSGGYDPSADKDKEQFFDRSKQDETWIANTQRVEGFKYELKTGTVILGVMTTSINSDLPGNMIAQVSQNIYDSATGKYLLIPQGSKLFGVFDSRLVFGQSRVLVAWNRILFPDGSSMTLPAMPGTDQLGSSGFEDKVNNHYIKTFGSAGLMSLVVGGTGYALNSAEGDDSDANENSITSQMTASLALQIGQTSANLLEKNLNIKPSLEIRAGYKFNIVLTQDLTFESPYTAWR